MIKRLVKLLYEHYFPEEKIPTPEEKGGITIEEVDKLLKPHCKNIYLSDPVYLLTSMQEAKRYSSQSTIQARQYEKHIHDCDNFSSALLGYWSESLKSYCFGIAWSKTHAFNIMLDHEKQIWICEPQDNNWFTIEKAKSQEKYYPLRLILI